MGRVVLPMVCLGFCIFFVHRGSWFMVVSQAFLGMIKLNPVSRGFQTHYGWQNFPNFTNGGCERDLNIGYIPKSREASKTFIPSRRVLSRIQIIIGYSRLCLITTHSNEINWGMFDDSCLVWVKNSNSNQQMLAASVSKFVKFCKHQLWPNCCWFQGMIIEFKLGEPKNPYVFQICRNVCQSWPVWQ
jgi:hypothetical protein